MDNNSTIDFHIEELFSDKSTKMLHAIFSVICFIAVYMNMVVLYLYNRNKIQCSNFNLCLAHLSGMNISQSIGLTPFIYADVHQFENQSRLEDTLKCGVTTGLCGFFVFSFSCVWTITFMSISRLAIIKKPLTRSFRRKTIRKTLFSFWFLSILLILPNMLSWQLDTTHGFCKRVHLFSPTSGFIYHVLLLLTGLAVPVLIQSVTYVMIIYQLYKRKVIMVNNSCVKHRKKVVTILGTLICINIMCWAPFGIYWLLSTLSYFGTGISAQYETERIVYFVMIPCVLAGVLNPICYALTGSEFRKGLKTIYPWKIFQRRKVDNNILSSIRRNYKLPYILPKITMVNAIANLDQSSTTKKTTVQ